MIAVYIIKTKFGTYYTGITNSIIRRWNEHNKRRGKYLSTYKPLEVIYLNYHENRASARQEEIKIKRTGAKKYIIKNTTTWQHINI